MNRIIRCALFMCIAGVAIPPAFAQDNASVTAQLNGAKPLVAQVKKDAVTMESYTQGSGLSWQTHVTTLEKIKGDVNKLQDNMRGLQSHRTTASCQGRRKARPAGRSKIRPLLEGGWVRFGV